MTEPITIELRNIGRFEEEDHLRRLFLSCDSNKDGNLDCEDLKTMCTKLNMSEHANKIINMLGADVKGFITFDDFLQCRKNVFFLENEAKDAFFQSTNYFESSPSPTKKLLTRHACPTYWKGFHDSSFIQKPSAQDDKCNVFGNNICKSQTVSNITSHEPCEPNRFQSSASENSLVNSGADYDSGAQDLCDEPQSLHLLLRCEYPDLYRLVFPPLPTQSPDQLPPRVDSRPAQPVAPFGPEPTGPVASSTRICHPIGLDDRASELPPPLTVDSVTTGAGTAAFDLPTTVCTDWVRRLFDAANRLHAQRTAHLRSEVRDLTHRLKNGQTSWEMSHREAQRLQRERDRLHNELANQCARYEDRLTELHSVIAELHRRLKHAGTGVANKMEKVNEEADECTNQPYTSSDTRKTDKVSVCDASFSRPDVISDGSSDIDDEDEDGNSVGAVDGDHLEVRSDQNLAPNGMKDDLDISKASPVLSTLLCDVLNRPNKHLLDFSFGMPKMESNVDGSPCPESNTHHWTTTGDETASKRYCSPVEYETALAGLQAQLACITEERDQLARQLNMSVASTANTTVCGATKDTLCSSTANPLPTPVVDRQIRTPTSHPVMGLGRQIPFRQTQSGDQVPASCVNTSIISMNMTSMRPTTVGSCLPNTCSEPITSATSAEGNIYDQPEPAWLISVLDDYCHSIPIPDRHLADPIRSSSFHPDQHPLHHTDQLGREPLGVTSMFLWPPQMIDDPVLSGPLSPHALLQFLTTLSRLAPYPRLADVTHRAQLTWSRLLATLGRLQADCLVLQANLAEVKTTADRMQCQLNQIEASLSASLRAACLADACLEISDCLNQLYSTELAIILYSRQNQKTLFSGGAFSTLSSSTTSSCSPIPGLPNKIPPLSHPCQPTLNATLTTPVQPSGAQQQQQQQQQHSRPTSSPSTTPYPPLYAVYAVSGLIPGAENNEQQPTGRLQTAVSVEPSLRTFKAYRHQAELAGHAILDRYDMNEHNLDRLYPTTSSSNGVQPSSSSSGGFTRLHPLSPGFFPIQLPLGPTVPSTQSLTNTSLYANSWYVSLGRLGRHMPIVNGGCQAEHLSTGSCAGSVSLLGQTKVPIFGPTCIPSKRVGTNTNHSATLPGTGGGWQTPDSGAGSSSTNEVVQHSSLLHPFFQSASCLTAASSSGELNTYAALLDLLPSPWTTLTDHAHARAHSIYDSDSDSSDSSEGSSAAPVQKAVGFTATHPIDNSQHALHLSTWTRIEERKLRMLLNHLGQARRFLRSTIVDMTLITSSPDEDTDLRRPCESTKTQELFAQGVNLPLNVLLENSVLLQELCSVKEDRADLKARVYLLEKELHANRLTLESHIAAEHALRAHLDALLIDQQYTKRINVDCSVETNDRLPTVSPRTGQSEAVLLRGQVKNLLQALEALRHSTELQQLQSEELVNDLKRANTALIGAFEKAKRKYLARIKKLESQLDPRSSVAASCVTGRLNPNEQPSATRQTTTLTTQTDPPGVSNAFKPSTNNPNQPAIPLSVPQQIERNRIAPDAGCATVTTRPIGAATRTVPGLPNRTTSTHALRPTPIQLTRPLPAVPKTESSPTSKLIPSPHVHSFRAPNPLGVHAFIGKTSLANQLPPTPPQRAPNLS